MFNLCYSYYNYPTDSESCAGSWLTDYIVIGIIIGLIVEFFIAHYAGVIAEKKGYPKWGFFALTLFTGLLGLLIVACLPDRFIFDNNNHTGITINSNSWICPNCRTTNSGAFCSNCGTKNRWQKNKMIIGFVRIAEKINRNNFYTKRLCNFKRKAFLY